LYDTDLEILTQVLIPDESKLHPKGITSIRSRVTNIKPYTDAGFSVIDFIQALKTGLLTGYDCISYELNADELKKAGQICNDRYANPDWNLRI